MKQGFNLYVRAILHLFSNIRSAVWVTAPAWVALTIITTLAALYIVGEVTDTEVSANAGTGFVLPPNFWTYVMVSQLLSFLTLGYIGPRFHRAFLSGRSSDVPFPYTAYLFGLMQLGLIGIGLAFLASRVILFISKTLPGPLGYLTVPVLFFVGILYVLLRFSVMLPSIAMGRQKNLHEAWIQTRPLRYSLLASLILLVVTIAGLHSLALLVPENSWLVSLVIGTIASWFALMVLLSYLNVIYRVTRRPEARMARHI
jgi:hypothetical protein